MKNVSEWLYKLTKKSKNHKIILPVAGRIFKAVLGCNCARFAIRFPEEEGKFLL
jgi:hypothetical protein